MKTPERRYQKYFDYVLKPAFVVFTAIWVGGQVAATIFPYEKVFELLSMIFGQWINDYFSEQESGYAINWATRFFEEQPYYGIYIIVSFVCALLGTIILSKKRSLYEIVGMLVAFVIPEERKSWGTVRDSKTKKPISYAILRLQRIENQDDKVDKVSVIETVSDFDGKYRIFIPNTDDKYKISIHASGYVDFTLELKIFDDPTNSNLLLQDFTLERKSGNDTLTSRFRYLWPLFYWYLIVIFYIFTIIYLIAAVLYFIAYPWSIFSYIQLVLFIFAFIWNTRVLWIRAHGKIGRLKDKNGNFITNAIIYVYVGSQEILHTSTDRQGILRLLIKPGNYHIRVAGGKSQKGQIYNFTEVKINHDGYLQKDYVVKGIKEISGKKQNGTGNPFK